MINKPVKNLESVKQIGNGFLSIFQNRGVGSTGMF